MVDYFAIFHLLLLLLFLLLLDFFPWLYCDSLSWHVLVCQSNKMLVSLQLLYARSTLTCDPISRKLCRYSCIGIYIKGFWLSLDPLGVDCSFVWSYFTEILSWMLSIVKGLSSLYNSPSLIYTMVWYPSGKFDSMWVIIPE